jgi:hypothetical protein
MSMSDFIKCPLVGQQSPSESLFWFCSVLFSPVEGTTCVPQEELLQADIGTSFIQCRNYFRLVYHGGTKNHSSRK